MDHTREHLQAEIEYLRRQEREYGARAEYLERMLTAMDQTQEAELSGSDPELGQEEPANQEEPVRRGRRGNRG